MNEIVKLPLDKIVPRRYNAYAVTNIEELASSIERCGVLQPVIVRKEGDMYRLVAGERRYSAVRYLQTKYKDDEFKREVFSFLPCLIYEGDDETEEEIYRDTNRYSRQLNNFQRIIQFDPDSINFALPEWRAKYDEIVNDGGTKYNRRSKAKLLQALIRQAEPEADISLKTITNYLAFWDRCGTNLRLAVISGKIAIRNAELISWNRLRDQNDAVAMADKPGFNDYLAEGKALSGKQERRRKRLANNSGAIRQSYTRRLARIADDDLLEGLDVQERDRAYFDQLKIVLEEIEKLRKL